MVMLVRMILKLAHKYFPRQVDFIVTPTRVIKCEGKKSKPVGICWSKVTSQMLKEIPVLRILREKEKRFGKDVSLNES